MSLPSLSQMPDETETQASPHELLVTGHNWKASQVQGVPE